MDSYQVLQLVGEGSFGRVHKGRKKRAGQVVALKFMPKVGRSKRELRNLRKEIEIMKDLHHPNIIQLFDSFETETEVVIVTEYAEGQLFQILEDEGNLPESQVRVIACQLVSALYYLHSHRILHRDMKPQNILLGKNGVVKLCDFGFARVMSISTLVLTSIKGTPLYMSPELVEEKPYDHTADLWALGCILYEIHTGQPPFHTNSMFHLVQLIVSDTVKWPNTMSDTCMVQYIYRLIKENTSFLQGLLFKDPQKRLSWPDLLHHPFVANGVVVKSDISVCSPLTVTPSPEMLALKHQQVAEKTAETSGESRLLQRAREQRNNGVRGKPVGSDGLKIKKIVSEKDGAKHAAATSGSKSLSSDVLAMSAPTVVTAANENLYQKNQSCVRSKHRGQIRRGYEQNFRSVQIKPQQVWIYNEDNQKNLLKPDVEREDYWEKLYQETDPRRQHKELLNHRAIVPRLKSKLQALRAQLTGDGLKEEWQIYQPLKVLRNLILTSDFEMSSHIGQELGLPHVLLDLIHFAVDNSDFIKQPSSVPVLGEIIIVVRLYWEKHGDWVEENNRLQEFTKPFIAILNQPNLISLAPLVASVLSLTVRNGVDVKVDLENVTTLIKTLLMESYRPQFSLPSGWGLCDGLLSLLLHNLSEQERKSLDLAMFQDLWKRIGASLTRKTPDTDFCSANGLYSFLSAALIVFTKDPNSGIPLLSDCETKCVYTLGQLLDTDCLHLFAAGSPKRLEEDVNHSVSLLSCDLLGFPFALDLPSHTLSTIFELYDRCGIVTSLLQVIKTLPIPLLEMPLSLLSCLLLYDPGRSISRLGKASFFAPPGKSQPNASELQPLQTRTASSLLSELLQQDVLWESAEQFLILLSQVARYPQHSHLQPHLEAPVLHQGLLNPHHQIRAATCKLLGNLHPFRPPTQHILQPDIFQSLIDCLQDSSMPVRRGACWAVGNWLGYIAIQACSKTRRCDGKGINRTAFGKEKQQNKQKYSDSEAAGCLADKAEQEVGNKRGGGWVEQARNTVAGLASLTTDPDVHTRRHCCAALANLAMVDGAVPLLLKEDLPNLLLKVACADSHYKVRRAAIATLCLYSRENTIRQVLISLDGRKKLLKASQDAPPRGDYYQLIGQLTPPLTPCNKKEVNISPMALPSRQKQSSVWELLSLKKAK